MHDALIGLAQVAPAIDGIKKAMFYGKDTETLKFQRQVMDPQTGTEYDKIDTELVHAILGIITEAAELGELLREYVLSKGEKQIERDKLINESGDELWYLALLFRKLGTTFEEVGDLNIAKLYKRFPDKFTEELAIHRDESKEDVVFQ